MKNEETDDTRDDGNQYPGSGSHHPLTFNNGIDMNPLSILGNYVLKLLLVIAVVVAIGCIFTAFAHGQNHDAIVDSWLNDRGGKPGPSNLTTNYSSVHEATVRNWENDWSGKSGPSNLETYYSGVNRNTVNWWLSERRINSINNPALRWNLEYQRRVWQIQADANPWNWNWNYNYPRYRVIP